LALIAEKNAKNKNSASDMSVNHWKLSAREWEVAELLSTGYTYRKIGRMLNIRLSTVQSHVVQIYQKAGVTRLLFSSSTQEKRS